MFSDTSFMDQSTGDKGNSPEWLFDVDHHWVKTIGTLLDSRQLWPVSPMPT